MAGKRVPEIKPGAVRISWQRFFRLAGMLAKNIPDGYRTWVLIGTNGFRVGAALCNLAEKGVIKKTGLVCVQARHYNDKVKLRKVALSPFLGKIREPILIIDDVIDTGDTIRAVKRRIKRTNIGVAVIFKKPWSRVQPDYYVAQTDRWVVFPWEEGRE